MLDMSEYRKPVHRSLLQREMIAGVPQVGLLFILCLGLVFIYGFELYLAIVPIILIYFVMRHLSKKDNWMIDIALANIMQKDKYLP